MIWKLPINPEDDSILSLDLQVFQRRLVTAGVQGVIKIYDLKPIFKKVFNQRQKKDALAVVQDLSEENDPHLLFRCHKHDGSVNCVRWNHQGKYFISGADDKQIVLWKKIKRGNLPPLEGEPIQNAENDQPQNIEEWIPLRTWDKHEHAVLSVAWSPDDAHFASCGTDSQVIIWNVNEGVTQVLSFGGGQGCGLAWDPCNKYLICQNDSNSLIVWENTQQFARRCRFTQNQVISNDESEALMKSSFFYRKVDFSPNGTTIISTNMTLEGKPVSKLITRDSFAHMLWFKGHLGNIYSA